MSKSLIMVSGDGVWIDPTAIEALVDSNIGDGRHHTRTDCIVMLASGQTFTLYGRTSEDVLNVISEALNGTDA